MGDLITCLDGATLGDPPRHRNNTLGCEEQGEQGEGVEDALMGTGHFGGDGGFYFLGL